MLAAFFAAASLVMAHANYKSSTPAKGEVLSASPSQVSITFTQDVQKITGTYGIEVGAERSAPEGGVDPPATNGPTTLDEGDRSVMSVPLQPGLPPGRYVVRWKNVSDSDGDSAEGAFSFYIGVQPTEIDLTADFALDEIGAESTAAPGATTATIGPGETPDAPSATAVPPPSAGSSGDGGGSSVVIMAMVAAGAGGVIGFLGVRWFAKRRR